VILGGSHASAAPLSLLADPSVDFVIRGEGERPLVSLLRMLQDKGDLSRVPNLAFRRDGRVILNPVEENFPLGDLPWPDLSDLDPTRYRLGRKPLATLVTSRGCPHRCAFCSVHATFGSTYRRRPVADVVSEVRRRWDQGYRAFDFEDDNLNADPGAAKALFRALLAEFGKRTLALHAMNGVSYLGLDRELLDLMARAGFAHLNLSLVSRDPDVCSRTGRPHDLAAFEAAVDEAVSLDLRVVAYQILGLPGEPVVEAVETLVYLARLPVLVGASPFYLPPGSPLAGASPEPTGSDLVRARLTALGTGPDEGARDAVYTLFVTARIVNFLKGLSTEGHEVSLVHALSQATKEGGRVALGSEILGRLLTDGILFGAARDGLRPLPRFRVELFRRVWSRLGSVGALDRGCLRVG